MISEYTEINETTFTRAELTLDDPGLISDFHVPLVRLSTNKKKNHCKKGF